MSDMFSIQLFSYGDTDFIMQTWNFIAHFSTNEPSKRALLLVAW